MKRLFNLMALAIFAATLVSGCQKYDDTQIRQEIKDLGERVSKLEAWCKSSQAAVDAVATLQEAVKNMRSVESVEYFIEEDGSGYIITFTNKQTIKLYNGEDGDAFFGNVNVGSTSVEFILADGTSFIVDRVTNSIGFESYETMTVARGDTIWTVMNDAFTKSEYAAFTAELKTDDGTATSIATKSATGDGEWKIETVAPEFKADGSIARPAGVVIADSPEVGGKGVLKVSLVTNNGKETSSSLVIDVCPNYLTFKAVDAGATVSIEIVGRCDAPSLKYSTNLTDWISYDFNSPQSIILDKVGSKVYWRNDGKASTFSNGADDHIHIKFQNGRIAAEGNVMSLVDNSCESVTIPSGCCFVKLFYDNPLLVQAPELPATELKDWCYDGMFSACTSLETAPELPSLHPTLMCYGWMFYGCTSLKKAPELPAMKLAEACYNAMFYECPSLEEAPELPATELAPYCYQYMFDGCKSLRKAPELPAEKLEPICYYGMFIGCSSLEAAPELPATELAYQCYFGMFNSCFSLKKASVLPATELVSSCYAWMYSDCTSLEEAPELPVKTLAPGCYEGLFDGCSSLKHIKVGFTGWSDGTATAGWVGRVGSEGTFECPEELEIRFGDSFIPAGWSVENIE